MLVDEFQDLTPAHVLMIRLLAMPAGDVFGVGDDDQTIYDHAGADPRFLVDYPSFFPGAEATALEVNYRCAEAIVEGASKLLAYNRVRVPKEIRAAAGRRRATRPRSRSAPTPRRRRRRPWSSWSAGGSASRRRRPARRRRADARQLAAARAAGRALVGRCAGRLGGSRRDARPDRDGGGARLAARRARPRRPAALRPRDDPPPAEPRLPALDQQVAGELPLARGPAGGRPPDRRRARRRPDRRDGRRHRDARRARRRRRDHARAARWRSATGSASAARWRCSTARRGARRPPATSTTSRR